MPDTTILISSYNQEAFLEAAIRSAQAQTVPTSIIVIDDGSEDGSAEAAAALGVRVVRFPHRGTLETFCSGVELVETPYFMILAGDDILDPRYVELTSARMSDPMVGFVYTRARFFGAISGDMPTRSFHPGRLLWNNYVHGTSLVRAAAYASVGGFSKQDRAGFEDWGLWLAMVAEGWRGVLVPCTLLNYRQHVLPSRNPRSFAAGMRFRAKAVRRHPQLFARYLPFVVGDAAAAVTRRILRKMGPRRSG